MSSRAFSFVGVGVSTQPSGQLYSRSSNAADAANLSTTGLVSASPTTETNAVTGKLEVLTTSTFTSLSSAVLSASEAGIISIYNLGTAADGRIVVTTNPADNDTVQIGLVGFSQLYTFKATLTGAADEIKIGAAASDTASNISAAINAGAGGGTTYGTGTVANVYVSSTVSGTAVTITDNVACRRLLAWLVGQTTGATLSIASPTGGVDGSLVAQLSSGVTQAFAASSLNSEGLATDTLHGNATPTTAAINLFGRGCCLRFKCSDVSSAIALKYQTSTDGVNWSDGVTSITSLDDNSVASPRFVVPGEQNIDRIRLVFTGNTNASDTALDARVIYPR